MKVLLLAICLNLTSTIAGAAEISGVFIDDQIKTQNGETLLLNGSGLRGKFWVDVYVGSLYLPAKSGDVKTRALAHSARFRLQGSRGRQTAGKLARGVREESGRGFAAVIKTTNRAVLPVF